MKQLLFATATTAILMYGCHNSVPKLSSAPKDQQVTSFVFGSCSDQKRPQPLWDDIVAQHADVWIWIGDNVYGDTENMDTLKAKYDRQKANPMYQQLVKSTKIIGVWDDHDFGVNDGGKEYPRKKESQQLMLDFLDVSKDSPRRKQEGAYSAQIFGAKGHKVKVILLDGRYFRDPLKKENRHNVADPTADILGEAQWKWLEGQLTNSVADAHIIGCGIQFIPEEHVYEKWANFPTARKRLFDLIAKTKPKGTILISGDRHMGEVSKEKIQGLGYDLYDVTSSGLTHFSLPHDEPNKHRVGEMVANLNYGMITYNWDKKPLTATVQLKGDSLRTYLTQQIQFQ